MMEDLEKLEAGPDLSRAGSRRSRTSFELLLEIAERKKILELFRNEEGEVCAVIKVGPDPPHEEVWPVSSRRFSAFLNQWFYEEFGRGVRQEVRRDVIETLQARGLSAPSRALSFLCSLEEGPEPKITVDLLAPDWSGLWIQPTGIMGVPLPPTFRRFEHLAPLWDPEVPFRGEPREVLLDFLGKILPEPEDPRAYDLLAPALPVLPLPIPRPILAFLGGHGSGKSFAQRMIARIYMPGGPVAAWGDIKDLAVVARQNPILLYDNLGKVPDWLARFLSVCVTGERIGARELYSDKEGAYYSFRRAVLVNGIAPNLYEYPDLMDRCLVVKLRRIPEEKKRPEAELERELGLQLPRVFSACLEALRRALVELPRVKEDLERRLPRMADFAVWGEAVARGMRYPPMFWFNLYLEWMGETVAETVESSPLGRAVLRLREELREEAEELQVMTLEGLEEELFRREEGIVRPVRCLLNGLPTWAGTPSNLLGDLRAVMGEEAEEEGFPRTPQILGTKLRQLASSLQDLGVEVSFQRVGKRRTRVVVIQVKRGEETDKAEDHPEILPLQDLPSLVGEDGRTYGPFRRGERTRVPRGLADALVARGVAVVE